MKVSFQKMKSQYLNYRKYNEFSNERFIEDLFKEKFNRNKLEMYFVICVDVLNQHALCKKKFAGQPFTIHV